MVNRKYFDFTCLGCQKLFKRRTDKCNQSHYCRPCRAIKTSTTHNMSRTRLYKIWQGMIRRCTITTEPGYARYGAKGITVCSEWLTFEPFKEWANSTGYSDQMTIDRIDNSLGYEPSNCRWATPLQQSHNRTNGLDWPSVRKIRKLYKTMTYADLAERYGVHKHTIFLVCHNRIWQDSDYVFIRHHRWNKNQSHTRHQSSAS